MQNLSLNRRKPQLVTCIDIINIIRFLMTISKTETDVMTAFNPCFRVKNLQISMHKSICVNADRRKMDQFLFRSRMRDLAPRNILRISNVDRCVDKHEFPVIFSKLVKRKFRFRREIFSISDQSRDYVDKRKACWDISGAKWSRRRGNFCASIILEENYKLTL